MSDIMYGAQDIDFPHKFLILTLIHLSDKQRPWVSNEAKKH